ncbi:MAG: DUF2177 family protein [Asticcacaulis sp.]|nr:DUF2177 family protein [Asticcacaulis sp.]
MGAIVRYVVTLAVMLPLDATWLLLTSGTYRRVMGSLLKPQFDIAAAVAFYLVYVFGVTVLVTSPASKVLPATLRGAVFGLTAYATYDLTALAVIRDWPLSLSLIDMAWGTVLTGVASGITVFLTARFTPKAA